MQGPPDSAEKQGGETSLHVERSWTMTIDSDICRVRAIGITVTMLMFLLVHVLKFKDVTAMLPVVIVVFTYQAILRKMARSRNTHPSLILTIASYHGPLYIVLFGFLVEYTYDFCYYAVVYNPHHQYPIGFLYAMEDCTEAGAVGYINRNSSLLQPPDFRPDFPHPQYCPQVTCASAFADNTEKRHLCHDIVKEVQMPVWLRCYPALTPVFVWLSFFVSLFQMCRHSRAANRKANWDEDTPLDVWQKHDVALLRSLQVIYTTFTLAGICHEHPHLSNCTIEHLPPAHMHELEKLRHTQVKFYEADFAVADLYEAFMLLRFSYLKFSTIKYEHNLQRGSDTDLLKHILTRATSSSRIDHADKADKIRKGVQHRYEAMLDSTEGILNVCVYSFVISCCLQTCFALTALGVFMVSPAKYEELDKWFNKGHYFLLGIGFVASTLAIYAIIKIECLQHVLCLLPLLRVSARVAALLESVALQRDVV